MSRCLGRWNIRYVLAGALALPLAASAQSAAFAQSTDVMRFGHMWPAGSTWGQAVDEFARLVSERSDGRYEVEVFPDGQLGNERENEESLQLGTLAFTFGGPGVLTNFDPRIGIFDMPFMFRDYEHANAFMDGEGAADLFEEFRESTGIRVLASAAQGFRYVLTKDAPVETIADLEGLKIRTPEAETFIAAFRALGANPVPVPWGETYLAFQSGVVDGMEGTPGVIRDFKMYEVGTNMAATRHIMATLQLLVSDEVFSQLPEEDQAMIQQAADEAWGMARESARVENENAVEQLTGELGVTLTEPDMGPAREAIQPFWLEWGERTGATGFIEIVQSL